MSVVVVLLAITKLPLILFVMVNSTHTYPSHMTTLQDTFIGAILVLLKLIYTDEVGLQVR